MKFKIATIGLLIAIFGVCIFTSYSLINETKKQTEILMILGDAEKDRGLYEIGSMLKEDYQWTVWDRSEKIAKIIYDKK